ncbi:hypothetical protein Nepgr_026881 [Nepenthes gracilis]|uniref:DUF7722 domain-containing protein n=1 Tax=Nepenthes gracilis TaxID=150966 RepID=A0AAD3T7Y3_NEPGR|nr:hypothetical protein Nepgr_026881 [Nepenthes gracilis]
MASKWAFNHGFTHLLSWGGTQNPTCRKENNCDRGGSVEGSKSKVVDDPNACFQMPLHYPRYKKAEYERMEEWKVDILLRSYGLDHFEGDLDEKRRFAMGAFLWPDEV